MWLGVVIFFCFCSKLMFFNRTGFIAANLNMPIKQTKKKRKLVSIRPSDTNNSSQMLTRMYQHTATKIPYSLRGTKIS